MKACAIFGVPDISEDFYKKEEPAIIDSNKTRTRENSNSRLLQNVQQEKGKKDISNLIIGAMIVTSLAIGGIVVKYSLDNNLIPKAYQKIESYYLQFDKK